MTDSSSTGSSSGTPPPPPPAPPPPPPPPTAPPPSYAAPAAPAPAYAPPGVPQYGYAWGPPPVIARNNGFAVASLVCSLASIFLWIIFVPQVLGIVFGHVALSQIRRSNGSQRGSGMAIAGLVIGYLALVGTIIIYIAIASSGDNSTNY